MIIDLPVLESIKELQTQHGLNYENYQRYRSYCSRKLHRIRKSLNVHQGIPSSAKARHQRSRKLMDVTNAMVLEAGEKDEEYAQRMLIIPLCLAERAWSYAMQLKQEVSEHPRRRFHLVRRLQRASEYAQKFEQLVHDPESPCSERTKREATAYENYITGLHYVERSSWAEAKNKLRSALSIYLGLCTSINNETTLGDYRQRIDEIRASLRYCAFNLGEHESKQKCNVKLPSTIQFHDFAFKHVEQLEQEAAAKKTEQDPEPVKMQTSPIQPSVGDDDDDEFEETREAPDEEKSEVESEEEEDDDDEDDAQKKSTSGGVTGLVKNWLGGWS